MNREELIDTILNSIFFKDVCPFDFDFPKETNEEKAHEILEDDWCDYTCGDNCQKKCWLKYFERLNELERVNK